MKQNNYKNHQRLILSYQKIENAQSQALKDFLENLQKGDSELIIEVENKKHMKSSIKEFKKYADIIAIYKHIPYFAIRTDNVTAKELFSIKTNNTKSTSSLSQSFRNLYLPGKVKTGPEVSNIQFNKGSFWNLDYILRDEALKIAQAKGIKIGVIDTGIDYTHDEIKERFKKNKGVNFVNNREPIDDEGHGTHVSGIIAGAGTGVAVGSTLYSIKVLNQNGSGSEIDVIRGLEWALDNKIDIVNMSLGSPVCSRALADICEYANEKGMIMVAAAGNDGIGDSYPASLPSVVSVAATNKEKEHPDFSNISKNLNITAPGVDILSSYIGNSYVYLTGTSMAAPHVTGALALTQEVRRKTALDEILELMAKTSGELNNNTNDEYADVFGAGLINAYALLKATIGFERYKKEFRRKK